VLPNSPHRPSSEMGTSVQPRRYRTVAFTTSDRGGSCRGSPWHRAKKHSVWQALFGPRPLPGADLNVASGLPHNCSCPVVACCSRLLRG